MRILHIHWRAMRSIITALEQAYKRDVWQKLCTGLLCVIMWNLLKLIKVAKIQHWQEIYSYYWVAQKSVMWPGIETTYVAKLNLGGKKKHWFLYLECPCSLQQLLSGLNGIIVYLMQHGFFKCSDEFNSSSR